MAGTRSVTDVRTTARTASERVLDAVATVEGCSPLEFDRPLNDVIDPDALDTILRDANPTATVEFSYLGYHLVVPGDGDVTVDASSQR